MVQMNMEEVESQRRVKQLLNLRKNKHCSCTLKCEYVTGSYFGADIFVTSISNLDLLDYWKMYPAIYYVPVNEYSCTYKLFCCTD